MTRADIRQSGRTKHQMLKAPRDAIYVWCNGILDYPADLSKWLGRADLQIVSPRWLVREHLLGRHCKLVIDHACMLTPEQRESVRLHSISESISTKGQANDTHTQTEQ